MPGPTSELPPHAHPTVDPPPGDRTVDLTGQATATPGPAGEPVADGPPAVPGYELAEEVGRGGMGVVYRARDLAFDRDVAVKVVGGRLGASPRADRRFRAEARITGQLQHPSVPAAYQTGTLPDGRPFLAMKLIRGQTLDALARDPAADRVRLVAAFEGVCQAVGYAHSKGIVHRDLKPANVMVGAFGEVQVMDWGLAKDLGDGPRPAKPAAAAVIPWPFSLTRGPDDETEDGSLLGTPAYMPPEQATGAVDRIDPRSDVFGLGGILCAVLTGHPPYGGDTAQTTLRLAAEAKLDDAFGRLAGCGADPELVALCRRCLSPRKDDRPADGGAVAAEVGRLRAEADDRARRAELDRAAAEAEAREQRKRRRVQLALAGAVGLLLAGGGAIAWWQEKQAADRRAEQARVEAQERERVGRNADALAALAGSCEEALGWAGPEDADRADRLLAEVDRRLPDGGGDALADRIARCRFDAAALRGLDQVDDFRWSVVNGKTPRPGEVVARWRALFAGLGVVPGETPAGEAGGRVAGSLVRGRMLTALDLWLQDAPTPALAEVLRVADPDPYRDAVRAAATARDGRRVAALAAEYPDGQPPAFAAALGQHPAVPRDRRRAILLQAVRQRPGDLSVLMALGESYPPDHRRPQPGAVRWFQAAVAAHPRSAAAHNNLGALLVRAGDVDGAAAEYRAAVAVAPDLAAAHTNLGLALSRARDLAGAEAACREGARLEPGSPQAHNSLGSVLSLRNDPAGATAAFREAIRLDPGYADAHYNLGHALGEAGDVAGAEVEYREAIRLDPGLPEAHVNLGGLLSDRGDLDGAEATFRAGLRATPDFSPLHTGLGNVLNRRGEYRGAIRHYRDALRLNPDNPLAHYNLGLALVGLGDTAAAARSFGEAARLAPRLHQAHLNQGIALRESGDPGGAVAPLKEAVRLAPQNREARRQLGLAEREVAAQGGRVAPPPREVRW